MRILVTGGYGYLGGYLCEALNAAGHEVVVASRTQGTFLSGFSPRHVYLDLGDPSSVRSNLREPFDWCVHCAGAQDPSVDKYEELAFRLNVHGTFSLLQALAASGTSRIFYLSSFHVYGRCEGYVDECTPLRGMSPYAASHLLAERLVETWGAQPGHDHCIARVTNGYGAPLALPSTKSYLAISDFMDMALRTGSILLKGSGDERRNWIWLCDAAAAIVRLLSSDGASGRVVNIASRETLSVYDVASCVASAVAERTGVPIGISLGAPSVDPTDVPLTVSCTLLEELVPQVEMHALADVVGEMVDHALREQTGGGNE